MRATGTAEIDWLARLRDVTLNLDETDRLSHHSTKDAATRPLLTPPFGSAHEKEQRAKASNEPPLEAAVLVPLVTRDAGDHSILLTRRSAELTSHRGQIAFPGGKIDASDASPQAAAIRETQEEIGIPTSQIQILGKLPLYQTGTGFIISPIVGQLAPPYIFKADQAEVAEIFEVPLTHFLDKGAFERRAVKFEGQKREFWAVPYKDYFIWGATAAILKELAERLLARAS